MTPRRLLFPALRCRMGDSIYYATFMSFSDVEKWIKPTTEIHPSRALSKWIQRQLIRGHAEDIAKYLLTQKERFFNAIVVGIYGGEPTWAPFDVSPPTTDPTLVLSDADREVMEASVGMLKLGGTEKLFAIDGQHRVAGIKKACEEQRSEVENDEVVVLIVGHQKTVRGERRTRRLFTTLNKTARRVSDADRIALDEDDGFAIVTRRLIDEFKMFAVRKDGQQPVAFEPSAALRSSDDVSLTTIISLYHQLHDWYSPALTVEEIKKRDFAQSRPDDTALDAVYRGACDYWTMVKKHVSEVAEVLEGKKMAGAYRLPAKNHLLMRPVGQRAFAGAAGVLIARGQTTEEAVKRLSTIDLWIHKKMWHEILWDPIKQTMLKSAPLAETLLLRKCRQPGRSVARDKNLDDILGA